MAQNDKTKWNRKYNETPALLKDRDASIKLISSLSHVTGKKALEIACGTGRNSVYLANKGFEVDALDISEVALEFLNSKKLPNIHTKLTDLEGYIPPINTYDLVVMTNYLDRDIIPHLANSLKKDGVLFIETYMHDSNNDKKPSNPQYLLNSEELKTFFDDNFTILEYNEAFNDDFEIYRMKKQTIAVKKV